MPDAETTAAFAAARSICRRHARSFYFASYFLPRAKRDAAYAVYAYCRMIDDAIDQDDASIESAGSGAGACYVPGDLETRLSLFRDRLDEIYANHLQLPPIAERNQTHNALFAFARTVHLYDVPKQYFLDLAEGCRMDLTIKRYATWAGLEKYCYHVAGVVGLIMSRIFELSDPAAAQQAVLMGNAMQLTNILRDVKEDFDRGRIYLPQEDLHRFASCESDLARGVVDDRFRALMRFEVDRARSLFEAGAAGLCSLPDDGSRMTASAMAVIYGGILSAIESQGYDVFHSRAHLTFLQKIVRLPRARRLSRRRPDEPVPKVF